ncbi:lysine--tRNA ligase, cytoplasmic [Tanacetum coccineum]
MTMSGVGKLVNVLTPSTLIHGNIGPQAVHLLAAAMLRLAEQNSAESTRREWYSSSSVYSIYKNSIIALMFRALKGISRKYENLENGEHRDGEQESLSGRVRNIRCSSYVTFFDLHGPGGKVQVMVYRSTHELDKSEISKFRNSVNGGDILGIVAFPEILKGELSIFLKTVTVLTSCLRTPQKAKSAASADNAWTPGRGRNPDVCILKDPNGSSDLEVLYGPSSMNIVVAKEVAREVLLSMFPPGAPHQAVTIAT